MSVIVCTHNRASLLTHCLQSLTIAMDSNVVGEVIVVDNGSNDSTKSVTFSFVSSLPIKYCHEENIGLSVARNHGANIASYEWLFYIDDDGKVDPTVFAQLYQTIINYRFVFFTGIYKAWWYYDRPVWYPESVGNYVLRGDDKYIRDIGNDYICGGIMCIKKHILEEAGFFPTEMGMVGKNIGYGEETYVEHKLRRLGFRIGINPNMVLFHIVGKHKLNVFWVLNSYFAQARDAYHILNYPLSTLPRKTVSLILRMIQYFFKPFYKLIADENFFWQNFLLDWLGPIYAQSGKIYSIIKFRIFKQR